MFDKKFKQCYNTTIMIKINIYTIFLTLTLPYLTLPYLTLPYLTLPYLANSLNFLFNLSKNKYYIESFSYDFFGLYLIISLLNIKIFRQLLKYCINFSLIKNKKTLYKGI